MTETQTQEAGYNGWRNYATWVTNLWLSNEQGSDDEARELAREAALADPAHPRYAASQALKRWVQEVWIDPATETAGLTRDLLGSAFDGIDWYEIADAYLKD
jgi:hypothetical protein